MLWPSVPWAGIALRPRVVLDWKTDVVERNSPSWYSPYWQFNTLKLLLHPIAVVLAYHQITYCKVVSSLVQIGVDEAYSDDTR